MINKKLCLIISLFLGLGMILFVSCSDDDNDNSSQKEWKNFNDSLFLAHNDSLVKYGGEYTRTECLSKDGDIFWKRSSDIDPTEVPTSTARFLLDKGNKTKVSQEGNPYATDTVVVRYMGWYYTKGSDGKLNRVTFDGTEDSFNQQQGISFNVNGVTNGFSTMLQYMDIEDLNQVQVAIPYKLGYGANGQTNLTTGAVVIPGYTTLYFNILMVEIKPSNPGEFPDVNLGGLKK